MTALLKWKSVIYLHALSVNTSNGTDRETINLQDTYSYAHYETHAARGKHITVTTLQEIYEYTLIYIIFSYTRCGAKQLHN